MVSVQRYDPARQSVWDDFVARGRSGTFLFLRGYMDYHADRFEDHSLFFLNGDTLVGLMPGNREGAAYVSHGGLTYGGIVSGPRMTASLMRELFRALEAYLAAAGMRTLLYKAVPHLYRTAPSEEDLYALFLSGARLVKREVSSAIYLPGARIGGNRGRGAQKAEREGVVFRESDEVDVFLGMVDRRLQEKYGRHAVHSPEEMRLLMGRFPGRIRLFGAYLGDEMVAGAIVYQCSTTAHLQYLSTTARGRELRAADLIVARLVTSVFRDMRWFDFGISTEQGGRVLNESLIKQKEEFGASAVCYDTYELEPAA